MTVQLPAQTAALPFAAPNWSFAALMFGMLLPPFAPRLRRLVRRAGVRTVRVMGVVILLAALLSCGSDHKATPPAPQAQTYSITVTAASGALTRSTVLTLTVR